MSNKISKYLVVWAGEMPTLVAEVNRLIEEEGAQPIGGVSGFLMENEGGIQQHFMQGLVRYESIVLSS